MSGLKPLPAKVMSSVFFIRRQRNELEHIAG